MKKSYFLLVVCAVFVLGLQNLFADEPVKYQRFEMNGFTKWTQAEIDALIKDATHIGNSITEAPGGYKANDFTLNTDFTIKDGVFTMTAKADFTGDNGMGFKNADRPGKLAGKELGAYPANFFCDLTNAEGIRFKIDITSGTVNKLNIGLSNCATTCFEHFVYGILTTDVDEEGYITIPFEKFKPESWSGKDLPLDNILVFIIEAIDATNGASISFSDVHGYKVMDPHGALVVDIDGESSICEGDVDTLKAIGDATNYKWMLNETVLSTENYWAVPDTFKAGSYVIKLEAQRVNKDSTYTTANKNFPLDIFAPDNVTIADTAYVGKKYNKNGFQVTPTEEGTLTLYDTLVNAHNCDSLVTLKLTVVVDHTGIATYERAIISAYPNPTNGQISIQLASQAQNSDMFLYDLQGRLLMSQKAYGETISLNLESFNAGIYLLKVDNQTVKIIKR